MKRELSVIFSDLFEFIDKLVDGVLSKSGIFSIVEKSDHRKSVGVCYYSSIEHIDVHHVWIPALDFDVTVVHISVGTVF